MRYQIETGDVFLCLDDYIMDDERIAYTQGQIYTSKANGCLTDNDSDTCHQMNDEPDFFKHFKLLFDDPNG